MFPKSVDKNSNFIKIWQE